MVRVPHSTPWREDQSRFGHRRPTGYRERPDARTLALRRGGIQFSRRKPERPIQRLHRVLVIMRVVSNMNSITEAFNPLSRVSPALVIVGWTKRVALRRFSS